MAARNAEKYIDEAIRSALDQDMSDTVEVVVADDGSTDGTAEIARSAGAKVASIPHGGISNAINTAIENSSGEFLMLHDADDILKPGACRVLLDALADESAMTAFSMREDFVSPDASWESKARHRPREGYFGAIAGCAMFRRELLDSIGLLDSGVKILDPAWQMKLAAAPSVRVTAVTALRRLHDTNTGVVAKEQEHKDYAAALRARLRKGI